MKRKYISLLALSLVATATSCGGTTPDTPENPDTPITPISINSVLEDLRKGLLKSPKVILMIQTIKFQTPILKPKSLLINLI